MKAIIEFIWEKTPSYVKWPIVGGLILIWTPLKIREDFIEFVDSRVHAVMTPMREKRDIEIAQMKADIADTKSYTRAIGIHLMGQPRFEKMSANEGDN
jgi:hypothetical protein